MSGAGRPVRARWVLLTCLTAVAVLPPLTAPTASAAASPAAKGKPPGKAHSAEPGLPLRATPVSTRVGDNVGSLRLVLIPVKRARLGPVVVTVKTAKGQFVGRAKAKAPSTTQEVVAVRLKRALKPGPYSVRMVGRKAGGGKKRSSSRRIVFAKGGGRRPAPETGMLLQRVSVGWSNGKWQGRDVAGFVAPQIGFGEVTCNPQTQWIRFYSSYGGRETAMMTWTYKDWGMYREKALREALDTTGTGLDFNEGMNKFSPPEKTSTGEFQGLISDRGPIGGPGGAALAPPTSVEVTWQWDFTDPKASRCRVEAAFRTETALETFPMARGVQVLWRGEANAAGNSVRQIVFPGLGAVTVTCEPAGNGSPRLSVETTGGGTVTTREGSEDRAVSQPAGPIGAKLPNNGMVAVAVDGGPRILIASRWKLNDPDPSQNWCAIAAQVFSG